MADLEDFFAKRDKKKKKAPKFEADSVAKILEKKRVDMGKSSYQPSPSESTEPISEYKAQEDDDEWREAVEHKPDFTGLKIQDLVEENSEDEENEATAENNGQREGPWKRPKANQEEPAVETPAVETPVKIPEPEPQSHAEAEPIKEAAVGEGNKVPELAKVSQEAATPEVQPPTAPGIYIPVHLRNRPTNPTPPVSAPVVPKPASTTAAPVSTEPVGKYVPVHLRNQGANPAPSSSGAYRPKKATAAPNIDDKDFFPSL